MTRQRKKKGRPISGWIILDKPKNMGSTEAVAKIKWLFNAQKAGHAGTLDPLASGLLPIALGEATKTVPYVMEGTKVYQFTVTWGAERNTDDLEGEVTKTSDKRPTRQDVEAILSHYTGVILQTPPQFSAIKIDGNRAYDLAREGESVEIPAREVEIDVIELLKHEDGTSVFEIECGKGTYVRSLARDMGRELGCYGYIADLRRIEVAPFSEEDFVTLEVLQEACPPKLEQSDEERSFNRRDFSKLDHYLIETGAALDCLPQYSIGDEQAQRIRTGNPIILRGREAILETDEACVTYKGKVLAIGAVEQGKFQPKRVFTI